MGRYIVHHKARIQAGETFGYGYWQMQFQAGADAVLDSYEYNAEASAFVPGVTRTVTYWRDQRAVVAAVATFQAPHLDQHIVIAAGVVEGDPIEGIRYPSPPHMAGWWIYTDRYQGDITTLRTEHLYHVTAVRPDLVRYLALPYGFRFTLGAEVDMRIRWPASALSESPFPSGPQLGRSPTPAGGLRRRAHPPRFFTPFRMTAATESAFR